MFSIFDDPDFVRRLAGEEVQGPADQINPHEVRPGLVQPPQQREPLQPAGPPSPAHAQFGYGGPDDPLKDDPFYNTGNILLDHTRRRNQTPNGFMGWATKTLPATYGFMADQATGAAKAVGAFLAEDAGTVVGSLAGGGSAALAAFDDYEKTTAVDAFRHTLEGVSGWWYEEVTQRILDGGWDGESDNLSDRIADLTYNKMGEGFEYAMDGLGRGGVSLSQKLVRPYWELAGQEWTPEIEAKFYAGSLGAIVLGLSLLGLRKAPTRPDRFHRSGAEQTMMEQQPKFRSTEQGRYDPTDSGGMKLTAPGDLGRVLPFTPEEAQQAAVEAGADAINSIAADMWREAFAEGKVTITNEEVYGGFQYVDFTKTAGQGGPDVPAVRLKKEIAKLEADLAEGFDTQTGHTLSKKQKKAMKARLKKLKKSRPAAKPMMALPAPEDVPGARTQTVQRFMDQDNDPHYGAYQTHELAPAPTLEWWEKWIWNPGRDLTVDDILYGGPLDEAPPLARRERGAEAYKELGYHEVEGRPGLMRHPEKEGDIWIEDKRQAWQAFQDQWAAANIEYKRQQAAYRNFEEAPPGQATPEQAGRTADARAQDMYGTPEQRALGADVGDAAGRAVATAGAAREIAQATIMRTLSEQQARMQAVSQAKAALAPDSLGWQPSQKKSPTKGPTSSKVEGGRRRTESKMALEKDQRPIESWHRDPTTVRAVAAGSEAMRSISIQRNEVGLVSGLEKIARRLLEEPWLFDEGIPGVSAQALRESVAAFLQKHGQPIDYGATFAELRAALAAVDAQEAASRVRVEIGEETRITRKRRVRDGVPTKGGALEADGPSFPGPIPGEWKLSDVDKFALAQEYFGMEEAVRLPHGRGVQTHKTMGVEGPEGGHKPRTATKQHDVSPLGEQVAAKYGQDAALRSETGFIGPSGRFYTTNEAYVIRWLIDSVVGLEELVTPLYHTGDSLMQNPGHHLRLHGGMVLKMGEVPAGRVADAVTRFGMQWTRNMEEQAALHGIHGGHRLRVLREKLSRPRTTTDLMLRRAERRPSDYPRDMGSLDRATREEARGKVEMRMDEEGDMAARIVEDEWSPEMARRFGNTAWGERLHRYWSEKDRAARKAEFKEELQKQARVRELGREAKAQLAREDARPPEGKHRLGTRQVKGGGALRSVGLEESRARTVDNIMNQWKSEKVYEALEAYRQLETPTLDQTLAMAEAVGYRSIGEVLKDTPTAKIEGFAQELGIGLYHQPMKKVFKKRRPQLVREILQTIGEDGRQRPLKPRPGAAATASRQHLIPDEVVSWNEAMAGTIKAEDVQSWIHAMAESERADVPPPKDPQHKFRSSEEIQKELDTLVKKREKAQAEEMKARKEAAEKAREQVARTGRGSLVPKRKPKSIMPSGRELHLEIELTRAKTREAYLQVAAENAKKRANPTVVERQAVKLQREIEVGEAGKRVNKTLSLQEEPVIKGGRKTRGVAMDELDSGSRLRNRAVRKVNQTEAARTQMEIAARKELENELREHARAKQIQEARMKRKRTQFNRARNEILRKRAELEAEGRAKADFNLKRKYPGGPRTIPSGPLHAALKAEAKMLEGKSTRARNPVTGKMEETIPKDIRARYKEQAISNKTARGRQRGAVEGGDVFGIGGALHKGFKVMRGILKRNRYEPQVYKQPSGRKVWHDTGGKGSHHRGQMLREWLLGSQSGSPLVRLLKKVLDEKGVHSNAAKRLGELYQVFGTLPNTAWVRSMSGVKESFYNTRVRLYGYLITGVESDISLANIKAKHGGQWFKPYREWIPRFAGGTRGGMTKTKNMQWLRELMGIDEMTDLGLDTRRLLDFVHREMQALGVKVAPYVKNYFPMKLKKGLSLELQDELVADIIHYGKKAGEKPNRDMVGNQVRAMAGDEGWMRGKMGVRGQKKKDKAREMYNMERTRQLLKHVPPERLMRYIETDVDHVLTTYLRDASNRMAYAMKFGADDSALQAKVNLADKALRDEGFKGLSDLDRQLIDKLLHITQREYTAPWAESWTGVQRFMIGVGNWAKLGMVVPGSAIEVLLPFRNPAMIRHWVPAVVSTAATYPMRTFYRSIYQARPKGDLGIKGGLGHDGIVAEVVGKAVGLKEMDLLNANHSADIGGALSNAAFLFNGLHFLTNWLQTAQTKTFRMAHERYLARELEIRAGRRERTALHEADGIMFEAYGIDVDKGLKWIQNGAKLNDPYFQRNYAPGLIKYMQENTLTAHGVNQPSWHSNVNLAFLRHLKTYVTMFGNTITPDLVNRSMGNTFREAPRHAAVQGRNAAAAFGTLAGMYFLAMGTEMLMDWWKYGGTENQPLMERLDEDDWNSPAGVLRAMNRWAIMGVPGMLLYDIWESGVYNNRGLADEGIVQDMMSGATGKDGLRAILMTFALIHGLVDEDGNHLNAKMVAAFIAAQMPQNTMLPRTDDAPAAGMITTREEMVDYIQEWLEDMGG